MRQGMLRLVLVATGVALAAVASAALDLSKSESWVLTIANVDGAPLRVYRDTARNVTCYFWRASLSCVRDAKP